MGMAHYPRLFFFTVAKKLKAKKTQATKKLKLFFWQKLKVPEDFSKILAKKINFDIIFEQNFIRKQPGSRTEESSTIATCLCSNLILTLFIVS